MFSRISPNLPEDFHKFCPDFYGFCPDFDKSKLLGVPLHPLHLRLVHHYFDKHYNNSRTEIYVPAVSFSNFFQNCLKKVDKIRNFIFSF